MIENKQTAELITNKWKRVEFFEKLQHAKELGLIAYFSDNVTEKNTKTIPRFGFIHRTFAEYFMAKQFYFICYKDDEL